jgi:hypothetical protein
VLARAVPAVRHAHRALHVSTGGDRASRALALAIRGLPADRADWGQAMLVELDEARDARARWRFSLGCIRAATVIRIRASVCEPHRGGNGVRAVVLAAVAAAFVLAGYGFVRYPGLRTGVGAWGSAACLVVLLVCYTLGALSLSHGTTRRAAVARRNGLLGGLAVGAAWLVVLAPTSLLKAWVFVPLLVALLAPASVGVVTGLASRDVRSARAAALWSGLVGGLLVFVVWVSATYVSDGRPYDPQLIRDFHRSHAHDLATYAVSDNLGAALGLLVIVPVVALALGSLGALVARSSD